MASPDSIVGRTLGHYQVVEQIGSGGMGVVYRAHDERLERDVALKVLPPGTLADDSARRRFRKEALALSRLNHPNIATVHDFDTQDGIDFLVTEFIPGTTLDDKLTGGSLAGKEVIQIGLQLADGLQAAHRQGVVHRDLKPGNLRLTTDGRLKILDFGLATLQPLEDTPTQSFTETGVDAGTLPYMAPEQLRGERADERSDLWASGVVLYELATGRNPFRGKTRNGLVDEILHAAPAAPQVLQPKLSVRLADIILKCLEKDAENRYQSAKELLVDLRRLGTPTAASTVATPRRPEAGKILRIAGAVAAVLMVAAAGYLYRDRVKPRAPDTPQIRSLAVLPLANLSSDPSQEYFADGMTESLITELSHIGALKVISRTSVMQYKGAKKPLPEIARELGVDGVITGSVMREGGQAKITVQLIHAPTDTHLWAQDYIREMRGILALQGEVARAVATQVKAALTPAEKARLASSKAVNPEAYDLYLRGRFYWNKYTADGWREAIHYFNAAIERDPGYASAYAGLADSYVALSNYGELAPGEAMPQAITAARKALELDPELAEAHYSLARAKTFYEYDWPGAEAETRLGFALDPNYALGHIVQSMYWSALGRHDEAMAEGLRARELDPVSLVVNEKLAQAYVFAHRPDLAITQANQTLELDPHFTLAYGWLAAAYEQKQQYDLAFEARQKALLADGQGGFAQQLATAQRQGGRRAVLQIYLREALRQYRQTGRGAINVAGVSSLLGQNDQAFQYLDRAFAAREGGLSMVKVDPTFDSLHSDPRFAALLKRMNLAQ